MWFMKYFVNPFMRLVLRSPLHGLMSKGVVLLSVKGRKSGRMVTLPVNYAQSGNTLYILPGMPEQKTWWRNLKGGAKVNLVLRGEQRRGFGEVITGGQDEKSTRLVADALAVYFAQFPAPAKMRKLQAGADGQYADEDLRRAAASTILVRVKLEA